MKKYVFAGFLAGIPFFMTSCRIQWYETSVNVPWWSFVLPMVVILTIVYLTLWIVLGKRLAQKTFVCPDCGQAFHPVWWKAAFSAHMGEAHIFRCPHCGKTNPCPPARND